MAGKLGRTLPAFLPPWEEPGWWERYLEDVRPRLVLLRLRIDRVDVRWGVPLWALEESLRFVVLTLPWLFYGARRLPARWRGPLVRSKRMARWSTERSQRPPWHALVALLEGYGDGMLRLERGEPFVLVEAGADGRRVLIEITQI